MRATSRGAATPRPRSLVIVVTAVLLGGGCIKVEDIGGDAGPAPARDAGGSGDLLAPGACFSSKDCKGGYCVSGRCCPDEKRVCGKVCCAADAICFANACIKPGKPCFRKEDCPKDHYCERALGKKPDDLDPKCRPLRSGRCVKLPPPCPPARGDAGVGSLPKNCIQRCEYRGKPGVLNAVAKWRWGPGSKTFPSHIDVWQTPVVGRVTDTNCDTKVDRLDPPNVIFISGDGRGSQCAAVGTCKNGVLRVLDGASGKEMWSLQRVSPTSSGFAAVSLALGDINRDGLMEIVALTGEGKVVVLDRTGRIDRISVKPVEGATARNFGWGGGIAIGDMDADGAPEIAYGRTVFTAQGFTLSHSFTGTGGIGGGAGRELSVIVDLDGASDGHQELLAGNTAYRSNGNILWQRRDLPDGFTAVGDFNADGRPEVVLVGSGTAWVLDGASGKTLVGPAPLPGTGTGGPPTVADFDGDGKAEIGVAKATFYSVVEPDLTKKTMRLLWSQQNHDLSSSVTGSTVFDFEGDGKAEVIYNDECFLWVYDGKTGKVKFAALTTSFTATEASLVADVDGDGHAEIVMISNGADPGRWRCTIPPWNSPDPKLGRPAWKPPPGGTAYRGITVWGDRANSWVGTRTLWNQHAYYVSNICDDRDSACSAPNTYGTIPKRPRKNWKVSWLNNFRQNVQDKGLFDAPDAAVTLTVGCSTPIPLRAFVRNLGSAVLPAGVEVGFYLRKGGKDTLLAVKKTTTGVFPGGVAEVGYTVDKKFGTTLKDFFIARIETGSASRVFNECRTDNNSAGPLKSPCKVK